MDIKNELTNKQHKVFIGICPICKSNRVSCKFHIPNEAVGFLWLKKATACCGDLKFKYYWHNRKEHLHKFCKTCKYDWI